MVEANSTWDETLVVITADHETGLLWGPDSDKTPFQPLQSTTGRKRDARPDVPLQEAYEQFGAGLCAWRPAPSCWIPWSAPIPSAAPTLT